MRLNEIMHVKCLESGIQCSTNGSYYHPWHNPTLNFHNTPPSQLAPNFLPLPLQHIFCSWCFSLLLKKFHFPSSLSIKIHPYFNINSSMKAALSSPAKCISHLWASLTLDEYLSSMWSKSHSPLLCFLF